MVIPQGVKTGAGTFHQVGSVDKNAFAKKSNTGTKIFIGVVVVWRSRSLSCYLWFGTNPAGRLLTFLEPAAMLPRRVSEMKSAPGGASCV